MRDLMSQDKTFEVRIGTRSYLLSSDDEYLDAMHGEFEPHMVRLFDTLLRHEYCVFDVGANVGCTSILFGSVANRVVAFEPSPTTFEFLKKNIRSAGQGNIELQNCALGAQPGESRLTFAPSNRSGGFVSDRINASAGHVDEVIRVNTLDAAAREAHVENVDFIKIDVEGFEKSVLEGSRHVLARDRPCVVLELNHWCLNAFQRICIPDFFDFLRGTFPVLLAVEGLGYLDLHDESESYAVMYHHILQFKYPNIVCAFDESGLSAFRQRYSHAG